MFKTFKLLFNSKNKDIRKRVLFTLGCLFIFIIGKTIPVPGTQGAISNLDLWQLYDGHVLPSRTGYYNSQRETKVAQPGYHVRRLQRYPLLFCL